MKYENQLTEILRFRNQDLLATICTNGRRHVTQVHDACQDHATLSKAIAYLEARGYNIDPDGFDQI